MLKTIPYQAKKFKKVKNFHFRKIAPYHSWWVRDGSWVCSRSGSVPESFWDGYPMIWKNFWKSTFGLEKSIFSKFLKIWTRKTWFSFTFKFNRLFWYECLNQMNQGECWEGPKWNFGRADFHLKTYFLKKMEFMFLFST